MTSGPAEGYRLVEGAPSVEDYLALRARSGLTPKTAPRSVGMELRLR